MSVEMGFEVIVLPETEVERWGLKGNLEFLRGMD